MTKTHNEQDKRAVTARLVEVLTNYHPKQPKRVDQFAKRVTRKLGIQYLDWRDV